MRRRATPRLGGRVRPSERLAASSPAQMACRTYRYLRLTIVGLVVLLAVAVIIGIGAALIAIRGRAGPENAMLNIAGMSAGVVALVPTPRPLFVGSCGSAPVDVTAGVQVSVWALLAAGLFGLVAGGLSTATTPRAGGRTLAAGALLWVVLLLWFLLARTSFVEAAHYAASALLFVLLTAVAVLNALRAKFHADPPLLPAAAFRAINWAVAAVMAVAMLVAGAFWFAGLAGAARPGEWMLWVETALIAAFAAFWLAQSTQFWRIGVPESA